MFTKIIKSIAKMNSAKKPGRDDNEEDMRSKSTATYNFSDAQIENAEEAQKNKNPVCEMSLSNHDASTTERSSSGENRK